MGSLERVLIIKNNMYGDLIKKKDRMAKMKGSASSSNLLGKMANAKLSESKVNGMKKALAKAKK